MKTLVLTLLLLAGPVFAGEYTRIDNAGHKTVYEEAEGDSAVTVQTFQKHDWDLTFTIGASGANNDSGTEENMLAGFGAWVYAGRNAAIGATFARPDLATPVFEIAPKGKLYLWRDPDASWNKGLMFKPFSWNIATGDAELSGGAFSVAPTLSGFAEWPLGFGAVMVDAGIPYVMTDLSNDVPDGWGEFQANATFVWWLVR